MNTRMISVAVLVVGILLMIAGFSAADSVSSDVSRFFNGTPSGKTAWLFVLGIVCVTVGLFGSFRWPNRK